MIEPLSARAARIRCCGRGCRPVRRAAQPHSRMVLTLAAAEGRFTLQRCERLRRTFSIRRAMPARRACRPSLSSFDVAEPRGTLLSETTMRVPADVHFRERAPWRIGARCGSTAGPIDGRAPACRLRRKAGGCDVAATGQERGHARFRAPRAGDTEHDRRPAVARADRRSEVPARAGHQRPQRRGPGGRPR